MKLKIKNALAVVGTIALLSGCAAGGSANATKEETGPTGGASSSAESAGGVSSETAGMVDARLQEPVTLAEGVSERNPFGTRVTIRLMMTRGNESNDPEPGPFQGEFRQGICELVAWDADGKELARLDAGESFDGGGRMIFRKADPFELALADYNGDGWDDFSLGQWGGSNGNIYSLFTLERDGFGVLERNIHSAERAYSIQYPMEGDRAFRNTYYDQEAGAYMDIVRRWTGDRFVREEPVRTATIR
ncbi:hypothetical protein ACFFSY_07670 [Paenibacillus aurantiacus]|uniref:VCBS repeat-containing protein n=1 Tax=Paenibacillus aurantiacus TaxID=1936118 RepID=A0ABV5KNJ1_9BACL